ncbi:hypothetical protein ACI2OX_02065 [Bacillus sp. N9]
MIYNAAEKLGVNTDGKTSEEIFHEIMMNHGEKVRELNLFPFQKDNIIFFKR